MFSQNISRHRGATMKRLVLCGLLISGFVFAGAFQSNTQEEVRQAFEMTKAMIPMRDGVKLNTNIFAPKNRREPLPIILERTPYNAPESAGRWAGGRFKALADD